MNTRIMVETKDEISRLQALQKEIKQLKELLMETSKNSEREGVRKLHNKLENSFLANNLKIGRYKLFDILREEDMLVNEKINQVICFLYIFFKPLGF